MVKLRNCSLTQLERICKNCGVWIFGAGNYLLDFIKKHPDSEIWRNLKGISDSDSKKKDLEIWIGNQQFKIYEERAWISLIEPDEMILIAAGAYEEILNQLDRIEELQEIICYILPLAEATREHISKRESSYIRAQFGSYMQIPKKIHYCWFGECEIPKEQKKFISGWRDMCPDYEIFCWNEKNYDITKNQYMLQAYQEKKYGFVVDYARMDLLYTYGGIYLDTDIEMIRRPDELLTLEAFAGYQNETEVNFGQGFGCKPNDAFLKLLRDKYDEIQFIDNSGCQNLEPSPVYQTKWLKEYGLSCDGKYQKVKNWTIFPQEFLGGMMQMLRMKDITENTFFVHHFAATWQNEREKRYMENLRRLHRNLQNRMENNE